MKKHFTFVLLFLAAFAAAAAAPVPPVIAPAMRDEALAAAQGLLQARDAALPGSVNNPFYSTAFANLGGAVAEPADDTAPQPAGPRTGPRSARELLAAIADGLKPSGNFVIGGEQILVFGQKRVKAGDQLTINFEGAEYTLGITAIDRAHFTVRLHNEVYTRPIK